MIDVTAKIDPGQNKPFVRRQIAVKTTEINTKSVAIYLIPSFFDWIPLLEAAFVFLPSRKNLSSGRSTTQ